MGATPSFAGTPGEFEETGSMMIPRSGHKATLLPNGKVLVAGGNNDHAACELYDPASGTWGLTGSLTAPVWYGHSLTLLANGDAFLVGGFLRGTIIPKPAGSPQVYNTSSGTWSRANDSGAGPGGEHTATLLPDGKVLIAGGHAYSPYGLDPHTNTAILYDPATGTWSETGSMANRRARHTATLLPNGKVLVAGGYDGSDSVLGSAELYDAATGTWSATGNLVHARSDHTATLLQSGKVLVTGGLNQRASAQGIETAELYDPSTGTWTQTGTMAGGRTYHTATLLASNRVLVTGGRNGNGPATATAELYDPSTGSWSSTGNLRKIRSSHTATLLPNNQVLLAGGADDARSAELYTEPPTPPRLLNISTRLQIQTGDNAMIGGFIITGTELKTIIVRGIGPSLGIPGALADPVIEVHGSSGELLATNDNWRDATTRQEIIDSGFAPTHESESALWGIINPGSYTVVVRGKNGATGIGSFEVYDLDQSADSKLANVSTRGFTGTGDDVMIGGIIVGGGTEGAAATVIVRAIGPSLPMTSALGNPTLELRNRSGTLVAFNDDWKTRADGTSQQAEIEATAFAPSNDLESAVVQMLTPDAYTAIVRGKENTAGVGLVEVFNLH